MKHGYNKYIGQASPAGGHGSGSGAFSERCLILNGMNPGGPCEPYVFGSRRMSNKLHTGCGIEAQHGELGAKRAIWLGQIYRDLVVVVDLEVW